MKPSSLERRDSSASVLPRPIRSRYSPRVAVRMVPVGDSRTKQSFKDECDVNVIMKRYQATGILPGADRAAGARYIDCSAADFQESMLLVASAKSAFLDMPSAIRDRFGNDPHRLMEFLEDSRNLEEARELGLVNPEAKAATPLAVRVVEPAGDDPGKALSRTEAGVKAADGDAAPKS